MTYNFSDEILAELSSWYDDADEISAWWFLSKLNCLLVDTELSIGWLLTKLKSLYWMTFNQTEISLLDDF